jgi:hypothetical protein
VSTLPSFFSPSRSTSLSLSLSPFLPSFFSTSDGGDEAIVGVKFLVSLPLFLLQLQWLIDQRGQSGGGRQAMWWVWCLGGCWR